jgi:hypothetical protein
MPQAAITGPSGARGSSTAAQHDEDERETRNLRQDRHRARPRRHPFARRDHEVDADAHGLKRPEFEPERHGGEAQHGHRHDENADERGRDQIGDEPVMGHAMEVVEREGRDRGPGDERRGGGAGDKCGARCALPQIGLASRSRVRSSPENHS